MFYQRRPRLIGRGWLFKVFLILIKQSLNLKMIILTLEISGPSFLCGMRLGEDGGKLLETSFWGRIIY
jgi:hypothetical protein